MNLLLFAGTKNGRDLALTLAQAGHQVHVSSATAYGDSLLTPHKGLTSSYGQLNIETIGALVVEHMAHCVIDSTHPYAIEISKNLIVVTKALGIRLLRYEREKAIREEEGQHFSCMSSACQYLDQQIGPVLFTTGVNELHHIVRWMDRERVYVRVLPVEASVTLAKASGINPSHVIALKPPFTLEQNITHIKEYKIKYLVTKDSGKEGNIDEKMEAVKEMGIKLIVVDRPEIAFHHVCYTVEAIMEALI